MSTTSSAARPPAFQVWWAAIRPATLAAGATPVLVGTTLAAADGVAQPLAAAAALCGAILIQIGTNLFNDYADFVRGADTGDRLGPARVTQKGWLTTREVAWASVAAFGLAVAVGTYLVAIGGWPILVVGALSVACGVLYTGGPWPLGYIGLGDVFVLIFLGVVAVCGTYYVQASVVTPAALLASVGVGAMATAILVVNNLRDRHTDRVAGKRTLVVRFGATFARAEYVALVGLALAIPPLGWAIGVAEPGWMLALLCAPLAGSEVRGVLRTDGVGLNRHLGGTARVGLVYGVLLSVGVLLQ